MLRDPRQQNKKGRGRSRTLQKGGEIYGGTSVIHYTKYSGKMYFMGLYRTT